MQYVGQEGAGNLGRDCLCTGVRRNQNCLIAKLLNFLTNLDTWYGMVWSRQCFRVECSNYCQQDGPKYIKVSNIFFLKNNVFMISMFVNKT